ncbi:MAG: hypothetical protein K6G54_09135 [Oscillospiraceae bacterium]|nr:hypothetical protein [Oscillospiraceae bacterium]
MKTSRLKNVVIAILALVNVFLLVLLAGRYAQERSVRLRTEEELIRLYTDAGVTLPAALIPRELPHLAAAEPARDPSAESAFAETLLGACAEEDVGGGIYRYRGERGTCLFRSSGSLEAALERSVGNRESFCGNLFTANGYELLSSDVQPDGTGTVVAARMLPNGMVFNARLLLRFYRGSLISVTGSFVPAVEPGEGGTGMDGVTALVRFLDYSRGSGEVCTAVTEVRSGYLLQSTASAAQRLIPAWCITTDVNQYYVNMLTGEVTREA